jgi:phosphoglycolate phosphatase-like HAD superfamily hydrolase
MRILTDFDGVFTAQDAEAEAVGERQVEVVKEALGGDAIKARALVTGLRAEVKAAPTEHGWVTADGLSCYADEDPYVFHNAVGAALYTRGPDDLRDGLRRLGLAQHDQFTAKCFHEGTEAWRAKNPSHLLDDAIEALMTFCNSGIEVVVVSNSSTARVESILAGAGMARFGAWRPRVRGGARKFELTEARLTGVPRTAQHGGRTIRLRRGHYFDILQDEKPDVVVGDVLSLDLALPIALREREPAFEDVTICLKRSAHTPGWSVEAAEAKEVVVIDSLREVVRLLRL